MRPPWAGSWQCGFACWAGRNVTSTGPCQRMKSGPAFGATSLHLPALAVLPSPHSLNIHSCVFNQINPPWSSPGRHRSCNCVSTVHHSVLYLTIPTSGCGGSGGRDPTLEQIPIVSLTCMSPASRSFPTGSNILLAMFNSYFTWGIESTKWLQLLRHYISVCPLLLPLSRVLLLGPCYHFWWKDSFSVNPKQQALLGEGSFWDIERGKAGMPATLLTHLPPGPLAKHPLPAPEPLGLHQILFSFPLGRGLSGHV